jgi:hypothetical protein
MVTEGDFIRRGELDAQRRRNRWLELLIGPVVRNGVVELWGTITDERERRALIVASENVAGAKAVHDRLVWIEPDSGFVIQSEEDEARTGTS